MAEELFERRPTMMNRQLLISCLAAKKHVAEKMEAHDLVDELENRLQTLRATESSSFHEPHH